MNRREIVLRTIDHQRTIFVSAICERASHSSATAIRRSREARAIFNGPKHGSHAQSLVASIERVYQVNTIQ